MMGELRRSVSAIRHSILDDWMWIRIAFGLMCVVTAYLVWYAAFRHARPSRIDIPSLVTLAIAVFGVLQAILRWVAVPDPMIEPGPSVRVLDKYTILHVKVWNLNVRRWLRPLVSRTAPEGCQVRVRYMEGGNTKLGWLLGRWNENPEPVDYEEKRVDIKTMFQNRRLPKLFPVDRESGFAEAYEVAFAVKQDGRESFHHFNDEAYLRGEGWRDPRWELPTGKYEVDICVTGYGLLRESRASFRMRNLGSSAADFGWDD